MPVCPDIVGQLSEATRLARAVRVSGFVLSSAVGGVDPKPLAVPDDEASSSCLRQLYHDILLVYSCLQR
jgi:hypothetical protein